MNNLRVDTERCTNCVMDTTDKNIIFDENGVCNHCHNYEDKAKRKIGTENQLIDAVMRIKKDGLNKRYDCIVGISGGLDSSYMLYLAKKYKLRCLVMHLDNESNTPEAKANIDSMIEYTGYKFVRLMVNKEEYVDLYKSYIKANVIDLESVTDHFIASLIYKSANELGIKWILAGANVTTEAIMGSGWSYRKNDLTNMKNIHKKFGTIRLKELPTMGLWKKLWYTKVKRIKSLSLLNYVDYNRSDALRTLVKNCDYVDYGSKHSESILTRFYQRSILPMKFDVDKRLGHLSTLINSGQMTRKEAMTELEEPLYTMSERKKDQDWFLKMFKMTLPEFVEYINEPEIKHEVYGTDWKWVVFTTIMLKPFVVVNHLIKRIGRKLRKKK